MNFLISGYYGYHNAGDEAVLAAMLEALGARVPPPSQFVVTSGDAAHTTAMHSAPGHEVRAIGRQQPRALLREMRACDVFISGGGSLLQDVTSLRNVVYYTALMRWAQLLRKPVMVYAQGVGPLRRKLSRTLTRTAMQKARVITLRDPNSQELLHRIGVRRSIEVTADPVWALTPEENAPSSEKRAAPLWCFGLRPWPHGAGASDARDPRRIGAALREAAQAAGARLRFLPMQPHLDGPFVQTLGDWQADEVVDASAWPARRVMAQAGHCDVMIAMRLHALIFAAAQGIPCVAINYDPKVAALARLIGAPLLENLSGGELARLPVAVAEARPIAHNLLVELQSKAHRNADLAAAIARK